MNKLEKVLSEINKCYVNRITSNTFIINEDFCVILADKLTLDIGTYKQQKEGLVKHEIPDDLLVPDGPTKTLGTISRTDLLHIYECTAQNTANGWSDIVLSDGFLIGTDNIGLMACKLITTKNLPRPCLFPKELLPFVTMVLDDKPIGVFVKKYNGKFVFGLTDGSNGVLYLKKSPYTNTLPPINKIAPSFSVGEYIKIGKTERNFIGSLNNRLCLLHQDYIRSNERKIKCPIKKGKENTTWHSNRMLKFATLRTPKSVTDHTYPTIGKEVTTVKFIPNDLLKLIGDQDCLLRWGLPIKDEMLLYVEYL